MAMQYKTVLYGGSSGIPVDKADVGQLAAATGKYLQDKGMQAQGIKLPGLKKATTLVSKCVVLQKNARDSSQVQDLGFTPELKVIGGLDTKGDLSITITGMLPPSKSGKPPINFDKTEVVRKGWTKLEAELGNEKNVVVNLTKKNFSIIEESLGKIAKKHNGDLAKMQKDKAFTALIKKFNEGDKKVINKAAEKQAKRFNTKAVATDEADFGEITTGTVVLAAHGSRVKSNGITLGTKLGKKTPEQIVALLTGQKDKKKNLSKKFKGTVLLSGCFTAAGGIAPPGENYDYDTFAGKVWRLLKGKGINCKVSGLPGQARTGDDGKKSSVKPTEQDEYDRLKKEFQDLLASLKKQEKKLKSKDAKTVKSANAAIKKMMPQLKKVRAEKEAKVMKELIMNYGLDPVR